MMTMDLSFRDKTHQDMIDFLSEYRKDIMYVKKFFGFWHNNARDMRDLCLISVVIGHHKKVVVMKLFEFLLEPYEDIEKYADEKIWSDEGLDYLEYYFRLHFNEGVASLM